MPSKPPTFKPHGRALTGRQYNQSPERKADLAFYNGAAWRRTRAAFLAEHPLCTDCHQRGLIVPANEVHHTTPRRECADPYDFAVLQGLCKSCHSRRTAAERG